MARELSMCQDAKDRRKLRYEQRKKNNMCVCGCGNKTEGGKTKCDKCSKSFSRSQKSRYSKNKKNCLCVTCGNAAAKGSVNCESCKATVRRNNISRYATRKESRLCYHCGLELTSEGILCEPCRINKKKNWRIFLKRRKTEGVCRRCGKNPARGGSIKGESRYCTECGVRTAKLRQERNSYTVRVLGMCIECKKHKAAVGRTRCSECLGKQKTKSKKRREKYVHEGKCIKCGQKLTEWDVSLITGKQLTNCNYCMERKSINRRNKI